jgi:hypothetical protein
MRFISFKHLVVSSTLTGLVALSSGLVEPAYALQFQNQRLNQLVVQGALQLNDVEALGPVVISGPLSASNSSFLQPVTVSRDATLTNVTLQKPLTVGRKLIATNLKSASTVTVASTVSLKDSDISGAVHAGGATVRLSNTQLETLTIHGATGSRTSLFQSASFAQGSSNSSSKVVVGSRSSSLVNGFQVRSTQTSTTVITPEGYVYQNGKRLGEQGALSYGAYRSSVSSAPLVQGPGWSLVMNELAASTTAEKTATEPTPVARSGQSVYLDNKSSISKTIEFESPGGVVYLSGNSFFEGELINGRLERL